MIWSLKTLGNAKGRLETAAKTVHVSPRTAEFIECGEFTLVADDGKFADSEDSFVYLYCTLDPTQYNFSLHAVVSATTSGVGTDQQSGFGLLLTDTDASSSKDCRHRNSMLVGCFGREHTFGARIVAGYKDARACESGNMRILDTRRVFGSIQDDPFSNTPFALGIEKNDRGLVAFFGNETLFVPGCDFLTTQDPQKLCIGFAVARRVAVSVSSIQFSTSPGVLSHIPEGELRHHAPHYPFSSNLLDGIVIERLVENATLYASPDGLPDAYGTREQPLSLEAALRMAGPDTEILLMPGVYSPRKPLIIPERQSGALSRPIKLTAKEARRSIISGSNLQRNAPLFVLAGSNWVISGIVFANSPLSGITISGSHNHLTNCEARENGDSGMLVISLPDASRNAWPSHNVLVDCDSHDNCDEHRTNADGFGIKLRVGEGNELRRCLAHGNVDDGFDLYAKSLTGPIGAVKLYSCIAFGNGRVSHDAEDRRDVRDGVGFKLGGERQLAGHEAWGCLAYGNARAGFSLNSNTSGRLLSCTSFGNAALPHKTDDGNERDSYSLLQAWSEMQKDWTLGADGLVRT